MSKILIVEDNEMNYMVLSRQLQRRSFEICIGTDGQEGLNLAVSANPDLILLDLSLHKIDGWEVARRLKADPQTQSIPIIALTAHAMVGDREKALAAGCDDYDTKPVDITRLISKINALLGSS
ncbi:MAG: response regulator [Haliangiales bacterium]